MRALSAHEASGWCGSGAQKLLHSRESAGSFPSYGVARPGNVAESLPGASLRHSRSAERISV